MPKISVIVPVYNVEKYLNRCVESILNQTYKDFEIILVDDGSPDSCPKMCDELAQNHGQINVIHKENGGLSSARVAGFKEAKGDYILFVDSDDYIENDMLESLMTAIIKDGSDMAICSYFTKYTEKTVKNFLPYDKPILEGKQEIENDYILPLIGYKRNAKNIPGFLVLRMMKRELISEEFFVSENEYFAEDVVFDLMYSQVIEKISIVNKPLYYYCINGQSLTNKYRKNKWQMLKKLSDFKAQFLKEKGILGAEERLKNAREGTVFATVDNAVLSGGYKTFLKEISPIYNDARDIIKNADKNPLHGTVALTMLLLNKKQT
ncbi:MAG: glycosyltransferase family 2 protein [Clostridia bacterium]|nr:glycosyltransferase family 2 protein [Clostridia bacterium]